MHEMSLVSALIDQVQEAAIKNNLVRVYKVVLEVGALKQVIPELMKDAFRAISHETIVQNADLIVEEVVAQAQCRMCSCIFEPCIDDFTCPQCQKADAKILKGDDVVLKLIEGDVYEG